MAKRWEEHTKDKKLPEKAKKTESFELRLNDTLHIINEARMRMKPAIITMNRGTIIPAHHVRIVRHPETDDCFGPARKV